MRKLVIPLIAAFVSIVSIATAGHYRHRAAELALAKDSVEAAGDTTRHVLGKAVAVLGDSLVAVTRRSVQAEITKDAIDKELKASRVASAQLVAQIARLNTTARGTSEVAQADGTRVISYEFYKAPYTVQAADTVAPLNSGQASRLWLAIGLDSAYLELRQQCEDASSDGVHRSRITVAGPPWLGVQIRSSTSDPRACSPNAVATKNGPRLGPVVSGAAKVGLTVVVWEYVVKPALGRWFGKHE